MPNYRRSYVPGGTFFFTVVTASRQKILSSDLALERLKDAIRKEQTKAPFERVAWVILPDHLHEIWTLPPGETDYSLRWQQIKERFTRNYLAAGGREAPISRNRRSKRERGIWQARFWEHTIDTEADFKHCLDYIHWNPVKHGYAKAPWEYPHSSFHQYVALGEYDTVWGTGNVITDVHGAEWD